MLKERWQDRTLETSASFNPAFVGAVAVEFVKSYQKSVASPPPYSLLFCAAPMALSKDLRTILPPTIRTGLFSWLERTPHALVGFSEKAQSLVPYVKEGIIFACYNKVLAFDDGRICLGEKRMSLPTAHLDSVTFEVRDIFKTATMLGKWMAAAGDEKTILVSLGVRP